MALVEVRRILVNEEGIGTLFVLPNQRFHAVNFVGVPWSI